MAANLFFLTDFEKVSPDSAFDICKGKSSNGGLACFMIQADLAKTIDT